MGFEGIFDIIISYFDINFLFKCFLFYNHLLWFFSLLTSLRVSMTKSRALLVNVTLFLNMWVISKYLLILNSNKILQ